MPKHCQMIDTMYQNPYNEGRLRAFFTVLLPSEKSRECCDEYMGKCTLSIHNAKIKEENL